MLVAPLPLSRSLAPNRRTIRRTLRAEKHQLIAFKDLKITRIIQIVSLRSRKVTFTVAAPSHQIIMLRARLIMIRWLRRYRARCKYQRRERWICAERVITASTINLTIKLVPIPISLFPVSLTNKRHRVHLHQSRFRVYRSLSQWVDWKSHPTSNHLT